MERLLNAVSAADAATEVGQMRTDLMRSLFDEQRRQEMRKKSFQPTEGKPQGGLKPWREVVTPHPDVASGRYQQAEFAADLWQVYQGEGSDETRCDPLWPRATLSVGSVVNFPICLTDWNQFIDEIACSAAERPGHLSRGRGRDRFANSLLAGLVRSLTAEQDRGPIRGSASNQTASFVRGLRKSVVNRMSPEQSANSLANSLLRRSSRSTISVAY